MSEIKIGDRVVNRCEPQIMTVTSANEAAIHCEWQENGETKRKSYEPSQLFDVSNCIRKPNG